MVSASSASPITEETYLCHLNLDFTTIKTKIRMNSFIFATLIFLFEGISDTHAAAYVSKIFDVENCGNIIF